MDVYMTNEPCCIIKKPEDTQASYGVAIAENPANLGTLAPSRKKRAAARRTYFWAPVRIYRNE